MRKPRNRLQVSTFPFLAVLLCAMGALILVLLAMDQRGRLAAKQKAESTIQAQEQDYQAQLAARDKAHETKKVAIAQAFDKKRHDLSGKLDAEEKALDGRLAAVRARMAEAARKLRAEEEIAAKLREKAAAEKKELQRQNEALAAAEAEAKKEEKKLTEADAERSRMTAQVVGLEKTVSDLKKARERDKSTYSVIPYHGQHGASRKPVYVECVGDDLLFHPDGKKVPADEDERWHKEVQSRLAALGTTAQPYVLVFIRPNGIKGSYALTNVLKKDDVEYGYEMVEADWKFEFKDDNGPASLLAKEAPKPARLPSVPAMTVPTRGGGPGNPGLGSSVAISAPRPLVPKQPDPDAPLAGDAAMPPRRPGDGAGLKPPMLVPPGSRLLPPIGGGTGGGEGKPAKPVSKEGTPATGAKGEEGPQLPAAAPPTVKVPPRRRPPPALRPLSLTSDEVIVYIECFPGHVVVHPSRLRVSIHTLANSSNYNPLLQKVEAELARRPPGVARPRKQIRFLVHNGGERTLHIAAPIVEGLRVEMKQQPVQPGDDVSAILAGQ